MENNKRVMILLAMMAEQSGEHVSEGRLEYVCSQLMEGHDSAQVVPALQRLLNSGRRFPTVAEVQAEMGLATPTTRDEALAVADTVIAVLSKFGWLQPGYAVGARARQLSAGPAAWQLIEKQGGWNLALERLGENQMAFRAQMRDLAETYLKTGVIQRGQIPEKILGQLEAIGLAQAEGIALLGDAN